MMWYDILVDKLEEHLRKCPHHHPEYHWEELALSRDYLHYEGWKHGETAYVCCPWTKCSWRYGGKLVLCLDLDSLGEEE